MTELLKYVVYPYLLLCMVSYDTFAQGVGGEEVLEGLGVTSNEIAELEDGEILAFSDEAYESTPRELSADAIVLVDTDLASVVRALRGAVTVIPTKLMIDHAVISSGEGVGY